ncbi:Uncharacterised protein [Enterococcus durans]|uniref:Uncharacterized protein n=1 Tax=Enterococcus durans TaxID=53345 RepID=A0A377KIF1_9ENTE|nr:Uncharacterised protein [Enterococcus durans]
MKKASNFIILLLMIIHTIILVVHLPNRQQKRIKPIMRGIPVRKMTF